MVIAPVIETAFATGSTIYAVIHNPNGQVWNNNTLAFESYNGAHWGQYAIALAEQASSGYYKATYPTQITGVLTSEVLYLQSGGSPALGDAPMAIGAALGSNVAAVASDAAVPSNLQASLGGMVQAAVAAGAITATAFPTTLSDTIDDVYQGRILLFISGTLIRQVGNIIAYDHTTATITLAAPFTTAPTAADKFIIV